MSTAADLYGRGPYTIEDLDALPEEGKRFELVHGWLIPMSPSEYREVSWVIEGSLLRVDHPVTITLDPAMLLSA